MNPQPIRIILIDNHKLARESWSLLLSFDDRFSVVGEYENGHEALEHFHSVKPDIILVDINMQPLNGFDVTRKLLHAEPAAKVIGISVNNQPSYAKHMLELGAWGFVTKGSPFEEITHAILEVIDGRQYVCNEIKKMAP